MLAAVAAACLTLSVTAQAAGEVSCQEPGQQGWDHATPAEAGMDAAQIRKAIEFGQSHASATVHVYRNGCLLAAEAGGLNSTTQYESWSLAKSITALVFGRALRLGQIGPDDPLGSLIPEADQAHGQITMRELLTMSSGLEWNFFRDYNIFMPDRLKEALTVGIARPPGKYWEYSQSGPALVAEAVQRAVGEDFQKFAQRELFGKLGISSSEWRWSRDGTGHTQGFFGLNMSTNNFAVLGELMRRGGKWHGKQLLSRRFVRQALTPTDTSGCYGYFIWLNASKPCVGPRVVDRPVTDERMFPGLPADTYQYSGLFGQWVTVFPSYGIIVARNGVDTGSFTGDSAWQEDLYRMVLKAVKDPPGKLPKPKPNVDAVSDTDSDRGIFEALADPETFSGGVLPPPLPPAGPSRSRATLITFPSRTVNRRGSIGLRLRCPARWTQPELQSRCIGKATLKGAAHSRRYSIKAGKSEPLRFHLSGRNLRKLDRRGKLRTRARALSRDQSKGTRASHDVTLKPHRRR